MRGRHRSRTVGRDGAYEPHRSARRRLSRHRTRSRRRRSLRRRRRPAPVLRLLGLVVGRCAWRLDAYCLLDNHFHLVLDATRANLSSGMQLLNGRYAMYFNEKHGRRGHLFGHRYGARVVEGDRYHEAACRYVAWNAVAAGLCERPSDWLWAWSRFGFED